MRELAIEVLARHSVPELSARAHANAAELASFERELAEIEGRCPWWERKVFQRGRDPARAAELARSIASGAAQRAQLNAQAERALGAAAAELPPIEIAVGAERLIARLLREPAIGRIHSHADREIAIALEALADRVAAIWVPGFDAARVAAEVTRLCDGGDRPASLPLPERDERLGFRPIDERELALRAAEALFGVEYDRARATLAREASEHAAAASALEHARKQIGLVDALMPGSSARGHSVAMLANAVTREHGELVAASESVFALVERAIAAFPPMAIHAAAGAAAGVLRAAVYLNEPAMCEYGPQLQPSKIPRAIVLHALLELRACVERAFPGLPALVSGRGGERDARALARAARGDARGPYRERSPEPELHAPAVAAQDTTRRLASALERSSVAALLERAREHAAMLSGIDRALRRTESRMDWADRLMFWSPSDESLLLERLSSRRNWHRTMLQALVGEIAVSVDRAAQELPLYRLRNALHHAHYALESVQTDSGNVGSSAVCQVYYRQDALNGLSMVAAELARTWNLGGDRPRLAHDISQRIAGISAGPPPVAASSELRALSYEELVSTLAEQLRNTAFSGIETRLWQANQAYEQATLATHAAEREITLWDRINIFTDSEAERARDQWGARAHAIASAAQADFAQADQLLEQALAFYPPASLYYRIGSLAAAVHAIHAELRRHTSTTRIGGSVSTHTTYTCELVGHERAQHALAAWTSATLGVFGTMASNGDVLEWFVTRELVD